MKNYYVFRINYNESKELLIAEIEQGRLRQGWGAMIKNKKPMLITGTEKAFIDSWRDNWGLDSDSIKYAENKYSQLRVMLEVKPGDLIIVPKVPHNKSFKILKVLEKYKFDFENKTIDSTDFRHFFVVEKVADVAYNHNNESRIISQKFRAYQRPVNRALNDDFREAVDSIVKSKLEDLSDIKNDIDALDVWNNKYFNEFTKDILKMINTWSPHRLENIVKQLFEKNGFITVGTNIYDGKGGDIDLLFSIPSDNILGEIAIISNKIYPNDGVDLPRIAVQVKKKQGVDNHASEGVSQLKKMIVSENISYSILINTSTEISTDTLQYAKQNLIVVIDGIEFSKLLIKYGLVQDNID